MESAILCLWQQLLVMREETLYTHQNRFQNDPMQLLPYQLKLRILESMGYPIGLILTQHVGQSNDET